ncbi:MAG: cobalamin biosynthesis protein CobD [Nitrospirae bacterium GWC2_57_9]|nr:MAG: cobalamin biosynthesis protein CobD [Nitrospirae bacterium GWC2_57_9]
MIGPLELLAACALDLAIGDPHWAPHPVRVIGKAISTLERFLRRIFTSTTSLRFAGVVLVLCIVLPVYFGTELIVAAVSKASGRVPAFLGTAFVIYLAATTIATRELLRSAHLVIKSIAKGDLEAARRDVSMIVGRDPQGLSDTGVLKATIETLAENLSDGIVAPLFYLALGGLPLAMAYKAVNTLDSMVGYKNEKYRYFGWAGARLDDVANYLPARVSGLLIVLSAFVVNVATRPADSFSAARRAFRIMMRDGRKHPSPNSGVPEAAMAGALAMKLGGPSTYGGVLSSKAFIGDGERKDPLSASYEAMTIVKVSCVLAMILAVTVTALGGLL